MVAYLYFAIIILFGLTIFLLTKILLLKKSAREIKNGFEEKMNTDTNTLIVVSSGDKDMRKLADSVNSELRVLRDKRNRFQAGDTELKNAVTNISHDLRTPLTAICGYLDLLEEEEKSENAERYIEIIRNRADMMTELTEELFRYSVIMSSENNAVKQPVIINSVLEESVASFYTALRERNITPNIHMPEKRIERSLDRSALSRVFSNLLNNAVKYSDGDLDITLSETGEITFSNTASGLNEVQVGRLFDRFYTVETARKSTGLGLAIARTLVEQMGGNIKAEYENERLKICVCLPE